MPVPAINKIRKRGAYLLEYPRNLQRIGRHQLAIATAMGHTRNDDVRSTLFSCGLWNGQSAFSTTSSVAESLAGQAREMQDASTRVTENMATASAAVEENAAAAAEMRTTTDHITNAMVPVAATASQNAAAAQEAACPHSNSRLALPRSIRRLGPYDQAEQLESLVAKFTIEKTGHVSIDVPHKPVTPRAVALHR